MRSGRRALLGSLVRRRIAFSLSPLGSPGDGHLRPIKKIGSKHNTNVPLKTTIVYRSHFNVSRFLNRVATLRNFANDLVDSIILNLTS